jgi:Tol biopolymer transport system component
MSLAVGARLGPYEILAPIGAGGMGEVYRARDTKLDRDVAIKVLPTHLASDPEALARFEREAKAVAALSHPNILSIHDFGRDEASGVSYAAMELLEGGTLRERLASGSLPAKKVVQIGVDLAQGLAAAHARGIVHRDVKPENVFVTADGRVKILDFGLARPTAPSDNLTNSPTALQQTNPGTVLGTVGYMSPEQVKGHPADHRSDIFSLGCVLYELATGRRAFQRDTAAETMTAILREDAPDLPRDSGASPAAIEPVIRHCLEKQPDERFQSARDLAFALQALSGTTSMSGASARVAAAGPSTTVTRKIPLLPTGLGLVLVAAAFFAGRTLAPAASSAGSAPLTFQQLTDDAGVESDPSISPDGASVAFARVGSGGSDIFVQRIGGRNAILVAGDPARAEAGPAFSPDGAWIAFHESGGKGGIFVAGATGESARRLTDFGFHPAWSPDGARMVFCTENIVSPAGRTSTSSLWIVDAKGGTPAKLTDGDAVEPSWSPSGARIAYWAVDTGQRDLYTMPAGGGPRTAVTHDAALDWGPRWSSDGRALYFASDRGGSMNIWRIAVDPSTGVASGHPEPITAGVTSAEQVSLSADGSRLVFRSAAGSINPVAIPFDQAAETVGSVIQILDRTGSLLPNTASPDGQWLVLQNFYERQEDLFVIRPDGTGLRRLTDDTFRDRGAAWSPDGKEIAFYSNRKDNYGIWAVRPDGSGLRSVTGEIGETRNLLYPVYSPTGDRLVASRVRAAETIMIDPRREWKDQAPEQLPMKLPDDGWLVPTEWSPDGRLLVGGIVASSSATLGVYDVASRTARPIPGVGCGLQTVLWLQDSKRVLCADQSTDVLWVIDIASGRRKSLATGLKLGGALAASPDRRTIYGAVSRQQADLWTVELKAKAR